MTFLSGNSSPNWLDRTISAYRPPSGVEMFPPWMTSVGRTFASGQLFATYFAPTPAQQNRLSTINNIEVVCGNVGAAVTLAQIGLWDATTLALLANTPDFSGALGATALNRALSVPLPMPLSPFYVGILVVFTTTSPQFSSMSVAGSAGTNIGHTPFPSVTQSGLGALPNPLVPSAQPNAIWFGLN